MISWGLAAALSLVGYAAGWLTVDGTIAAVLVGGAVFAGGGLPGGLLLALFFVSGSVLTQLNRRAGLAPADSPRTARNALQVCANGLWAAAGAMLVAWRPGTGWAILVGALAAAQSDTWATEIGARARAFPRLITTWVPVPRGASGGVTARGTIGGLAGALASTGLGVATGIPVRVVAAGLIGGVLGMAVDSLLGATVQGQFHCDSCGEATEQRRHRCGALSRPTGGWRWLDNNGVNLLATGAGGSTAALLHAWL